jgi:hypothetical protein
MTTPPSDDSQPAEHEPVSLDKPEADESFDPYRFGAPEHPVPPEYAPPGYRPPPPTEPPPPPPSQQDNPPTYAGYPGYPGYQGHPGYGPQYQGPPAYGPPPPWMSQYPPPSGSGKAVAALVLGIVSVLLFWLSVFDVIPVLLAIILGSVAISDAKRTGRGRSMAMWGIVLAVVGAVAAIAITVWVYPKVKDCLDSYDQNSSEFDTCLHQKF